MRPFAFQRAEEAQVAIAEAAKTPASPGEPATEAAAQFLAGGTTLVDLMKLDVMHPERVIDINGLWARHAYIVTDDAGLRLGALARMADVADHPAVKRDYPVIAETLAVAGSPQLRNMATLGGNVLQRTRCTYFRDVAWKACNKRALGSGCAALDGINRRHAVLGTSENCIATYPGDFAQALIALDASVQILGSDGAITIPFAELHREPGDTPHLETRLAPGALITAFDIPAGPWTRRSLYVKIRDRGSYEFALASAAVALELDSAMVASARIALGGVATVPWRAREAEAALQGHVLDEERAEEAARIAFAPAKAQRGNAFKLDLGKRTLVRALLQAARMEV
jgi:xanthine dehydrogenase YagS FAD-binding subunit